MKVPWFELKMANRIGDVIEEELILTVGKGNSPDISEISSFFFATILLLAKTRGEV